MNFEDLKERMRESLSSYWSRFQESSLWILLSERYQNLSPNGQRAALAGIGFAFGFTLLAIPLVFYFFPAKELETDFTDKRQVIRDLYRVSREVKVMPPAPTKPYDLASIARSRLESARLAPDQIQGVSPDNPGDLVGIPKALEKQGVVVSVRKVNLRQVVDVGHDLQVMHPSVKMAGLEIKANAEDNHFFDVIYKLVAVSVPAPEAVTKVPTKNGNRFKGNGKSNGLDNANNDDE